MRAAQRVYPYPRAMPVAIEVSSLVDARWAMRCATDQSA